MRGAACLLVLLAGCNGGDGAPAPLKIQSNAQPAAPQPELHTATTAFGSFLVTWHSAPDPIPTNESFDIRATVANADSSPAEGVLLGVDASMPQHGHGMYRVPVIERDGAAFVARGMLFHMPGSWELAFDVTAGGVTERAAVEVVLE